MSGRRRLIVNADGFGFTHGNNRGVFDTLPAGFVTSVSVNANFPATDAVRELASRFPQAGIGIHFNLCVGRPVLDPSRVPSLVNADGEFWYRAFPARAMTGRIDPREAEAELAAQAARLADLGVLPTHWDSHRGDHAYPPFLWAAVRVARRLGIPGMRTHRFHTFWRSGWPPARAAVRYAKAPQRAVSHAWRAGVAVVGRLAGFRMADRCVVLDPDSGDRPERFETWMAVLDGLPEGVTEAWCHPGYPDDELRRWSGLVESRAEQVAALSDPRLVEHARRIGVELVTFRDL